jgi:hypothetical protein
MGRGGAEKASWSITKVAASGTIWLRFAGPTRTEEVPEFLSGLSDMMPEESANIVFDLRELVGHNPETKEPIKDWLQNNKSRIGQITVLVPKSGAILKMVIAVMSLATGIKIHIRDDAAESLSFANF